MKQEIGEKSCYLLISRGEGTSDEDWRGVLVAWGLGGCCAGDLYAWQCVEASVDKYRFNFRRLKPPAMIEYDLDRLDEAIAELKELTEDKREGVVP